MAGFTQDAGMKTQDMVNVKTRRLVWWRLVVVVPILLGAFAWGLQAMQVASESKNPVQGNVTGIVYDLPEETLSQVFLGNSTYVKSTGDVPYYVVVQSSVKRAVGEAVGFVFVTTDIAPGWSYGYSGYILVLAGMDLRGVVVGVRVLEHNEPRAYHVLDQVWLDTLVGKNVSQSFRLGADIDGVSGATYTAMGVVNGVRQSGRLVLADYGTHPFKSPEVSLLAFLGSMTSVDDYAESLVLSGLVGIGVIGLVRRSEVIRYGVMFASLAYVGFWKGRMVSIVDILNLRNLVLPPLYGNLFWYVLFGSTLLLSMLWGRHYCGWLCPFGAVTEFLSKLFPFRVKVPARLERKASLLKYGVLAAVAVIVVATGDLAATGIEPFATFFLAEGAGWMWMVLVIVLAVSLAVHRVLCRYLCPAGAVLALLAKLRVYEIRRWQECSSCRLCEQGCPVGALAGGRVSATDCLDCGVCEENYVNPRVCPHWLHLRSSNNRPTPLTRLPVNTRH